MLNEISIPWLKPFGPILIHQKIELPRTQNGEANTN